jgi:alpha-L-rhamnosidase
VDLPGWYFVDWTCLDSRCNDGAVQGWYLEALECGARLARAAGDRSAAGDYARRARRLRASIARVYWSQARQAFLKYRPGSPIRPPQAPPDLIGQHENFLFPLLKVGTPGMRRRALAAVAGSAGKFLPDLGGIQSSHGGGGSSTYAGEEVIRLGSPFWSFYALLSLMEAGKVVEALEYMRIGWGMMLDAGATSCWEMWDRHTSLCHGWSAAPVMVLPAYVLGVRPTGPGFERFEVRPRPGDLAWARGRVPTPRGDVVVAWDRRGARGFRCDVTVPPGTRAIFVAPAPGRRTALGPGRHRIVIGRGR